MIHRALTAKANADVLGLFFLMIRRPPRSTPLSLHDALPIWERGRRHGHDLSSLQGGHWNGVAPARLERDRKSTRLNSSHGYISYAVFCLKKKAARRTSGKRGLLSWRPAEHRRYPPGHPGDAG